MLENLQNGKKGSSKGFRRGKNGWSKGESRDVLKFSTMEAGKGGRPENYKQVRLKLQSGRLKRSWRDQRAHGTNKGRGRPQLVQVDDLLVCTRFFSNVERWGRVQHVWATCVNSPETKRPDENCYCQWCLRPYCVQNRDEALANRGTSTEGTGWWSRARVCASLFSQSGESGAAPAVWADEESVDHRRQSCQTSPCEGREVARDSVLVDRQRQGTSRRRTVHLQAFGG